MGKDLSLSGWKIVRLKEIASHIQYGYTAKAKDTDTGPRFLRITDIQDDTVNWATVPSCEIAEKEKEKYLLCEGDIVFARTGATVGKSYLIRGNVPDAVFASYLIRLRLNKGIEPKYVSYFFRSPDYWRQISENQAGIGQPNVNGSKLADLEIPLASPEDQKQIVAEIEKQFSRLDEAVTALKRIQVNLKRYKAAVLKAAVEGKLTEQWRKDHPDVEPADQLLKRILAERRAKWESEELAKMKAKGIKPKDDSWKKKYKEPTGPDTANLPGLTEMPEGWVWASMEQLAALVTDGDHNPPKRTVSGICHLTAKHVRDWRLDPTDCTYISKDNAVNVFKRYSPMAGDLIVTCVGTVGRTAIVPESFEFSPDRNLAAVRLLPRSVNAKFVQIFLESPDIQKVMKTSSGSTAQPHLYLSDLRSISISFPSVDEQYQVVAEVERRLSVTEELEATIKTNLKRAEHLRQTILNHAFCGHSFKDT